MLYSSEKALRIGNGHIFLSTMSEISFRRLTEMGVSRSQFIKESIL